MANELYATKGRGGGMGIAEATQKPPKYINWVMFGVPYLPRIYRVSTAYLPIASVSTAYLPRIYRVSTYRIYTVSTRIYRVSTAYLPRIYRISTKPVNMW